MAIKSSQTKFPQGAEQPYPSNARAHWGQLSNLKTQSSDVKTNYAQTALVTGKSGTRPGVESLLLKNFHFTIPEGAEIESVVVRLYYALGAKVTDKYPKFGQIKLRMLLSAGDIYDTEQLLVSPSKDWKGQKKTWNADNYALPTAEVINNKNFGIALSFPYNTNEESGYVYLNNVSVTVNYKTPEYGVDIVASANNDEFVKDVPFNTELVLNNPDLMEYSPTLEITVPSDMTLAPVGIVAESTFRKISDTKYQWKPLYSTTFSSTEMETIEVYDTRTGRYTTITRPKTITSGVVKLQCTATSASTGDKAITITETYTNHSKTIHVNVIGQSIITPDETKLPSEQLIYAIQDVPFTIPIKIPESMVGTIFYLYVDKNLEILEDGSYVTVNAGDFYQIPAGSFSLDGTCNLTAKDTNDIDPYPTSLNTSHTETVKVSLTTDNTTIPESVSFVILVVGEDYDVPRLTVMKLSAEECNRLGDGFNYTVESYVRINCQSQYVAAYVDFFRNFRIGVVNSIEETMNLTTIFNACTHWSDGLTLLNDFEKDTVEFTYDKDYPVYIIITGTYDTTIANFFENEYTSPQIIETNREDGYGTVLFPVPIQDIISDEAESVADLTLPSANNSNNLIFYNLPLEDTFKSRNNLAVRGIECRVTASTDYVATLSAKLHSPKGFNGLRSIILNPSTPTHVVGGKTDRWGFSISELMDITDFELELNVVNNTGVESNVSIEKVEVIVYYVFFEKQLVDWLVDDENMAAFNCFLQDVSIPEGLKTSVKYLSADGTDTNNAFRQNIKEKEITVEFDIDECSIDDSTATLQEVTEKLTTQRDDLFRPIPKRLEFSHYPDIYWEYILEDTIEAKADGSSYECKAKLTIPAGTAYTKEELTTGKSGRVAGLAKINPVILVTPSSSHLEISDRFTNQKFVMSYSGWSTSDTVEIDCSNRKVLLHQDETVKDITINADANTDWFLLSDQFYLEETGCIIQSVTWTERR